MTFAFSCSFQQFDEACKDNRGKLDAAAASRANMEKQTKADNEVETLNARWDTVKKVAEERVTKVRMVKLEAGRGGAGLSCGVRDLAWSVYSSLCL